MEARSKKERMLWAQFDALEMGSGWTEEDIVKPQILIEDVYGDSHPGSVHLNQVTEQVKWGVVERGGFGAKYHVTDICDGCAQGHDGMNAVLASREAICDMVEVHASALPWDGMVLASSCDKSIPAHLKAAARMDIPAIFLPGGRGYLPAPEEEGCHYPPGDTGLQAYRLPLRGSLHLLRHGLHHAVHGGGFRDGSSRQRPCTGHHEGSYGLRQGGWAEDYGVG